MAESNGLCGPREPIPKPSMKNSRTDEGRSDIIPVAQNAAGAILIQFVVQGLQTYLQEFRGARLVVAGLLERAQDHLPLHLFQRSADGKGDGVFIAQLLSLIE